MDRGSLMAEGAVRRGHRWLLAGWSEHQLVPWHSDLEERW